MPAVPLTFRSVCGGHFATVYASFMLKRARFSLAMRMSILRLRTRADGVTVGVLLTLLYYGNLIHRCGYVELNPGPDRKTDGTRQTLLDSVTGGTTQRHSSRSRSRKDSSRKDSVERTGSTPETLTGLPSDPSLSDVMSMLTNLCLTAVTSLHCLTQSQLSTPLLNTPAILLKPDSRNAQPTVEGSSWSCRTVPGYKPKARGIDPRWAGGGPALCPNAQCMVLLLSLV
ncbi:hypothetical protein ACOMHN_011866 [Nucella lapillus]